MRIDAQQKELFELLSGNQRYEVPMYQRNYAWRAEQVTAFLEDLDVAFESGEDHFFGSVVMLAPEKSGNAYSIIDGQQRMTTFMILISVIRDQIFSFADSSVMVNGLPVNLDSIATGLLRSDSNFDLRFDSNNMIKEIFDRYVQLEPAAAGRKNFAPNGAGLSADEKKATLDLRRSYSLISKWLHSKLVPFAGDEETMKFKLFKLLSTVRTSVKVLRLVVDNEDDAFLLFETLNDRGLRLTPSDLLKSFTLRKIKEGEKVIGIEEALERWDAAVDALGEYSFTKFLRHYLLSVQAEKVQVAKIFGEFKKIVDEYDEVSPGGALRNLNELVEGAKDYAMLLGDGGTSDTKLNRVIARLNMLSETHRILLLRAIHFRFETKQIKQLALALEVLVFRWIITGGNAQEIESFYQSRADELKSDDVAILNGVISKIIAKAPADDAVKSAMKQNPASRVPGLQFYVLQKLNYGVTGAELVWSNSQLHIEHLAPQRPLVASNWWDVVAPKQSADPNEKVYDDFMTQWGNLTLLEYEINTSIGNAEWDVKLVGSNGDFGLNNSSVSITQDILRISQWDRAHINARTAWVADSMVQLTSLVDYSQPGSLNPYQG